MINFLLGIMLGFFGGTTAKAGLGEGIALVSLILLIFLAVFRELELSDD